MLEHQTKLKLVQFRPKKVVRREEQWNAKGSGSTERGVGTQKSCRGGWMGTLGNGNFQVFQVRFELRDRNRTVFFCTTTERRWKRPQIASTNEAAVVVLWLVDIEK